MIEGDRLPTVRQLTADLGLAKGTIARLYAKGVVMSGLPLQEALKAVNFFRDHILESAVVLPEAASRRPEANQRMFRRLNAFLNEVQLQIADCYEALGSVTQADPDQG